MRTFIQPFNNYVEVAPQKKEELVLDSGLAMIPGYDDDVGVGQVLATDVGSSLRLRDTIIYWTGFLVRVNVAGVPMFFVKEEHVVAKVTELKDE